MTQSTLLQYMSTIINAVERLHMHPDEAGAPDILLLRRNLDKARSLVHDLSLNGLPITPIEREASVYLEAMYNLANVDEGPLLKLIAAAAR